MDAGIKAILYGVGSRLINYGFGLFTAPRHNPVETRIQHLDRLIQALPAGELIEPLTTTPVIQNEGLLPATVSETIPEESPMQDIAIACVPCSVGHFSTCAGLLNEAARFKKEGLTSNQVIDDIGKCIMELNALERVDLTPEKIQTTKGWEKPIAKEALQQSRNVRHRLEEVESMEEIERIAADTQQYYTQLMRQWVKGRFSNLGTRKADAIAQRVGEK